MDTLLAPLAPGRILARKYEVVGRVGRLLKLSERATGIERTARAFGGEGERLVSRYAQRLHKLRHCDVLMQYRTQETVSLDGLPVTFLVSDSIDGVFLADYLAGRPFRRMLPFEGLHFLRALAHGVEPMHRLGEPHGALIAENVIVRKVGLGFKVKLVDLLPSPEMTEAHVRLAIRADVADLLGIFTQAVYGEGNGQKANSTIRNLLGGRHRDAGDLVSALDHLDWTR